MSFDTRRSRSRLPAPGPLVLRLALHGSNNQGQRACCSESWALPMPLEHGQRRPPPLLMERLLAPVPSCLTVGMTRRDHNAVHGIRCSYAEAGASNLRGGMLPLIAQARAVPPCCPGWGQLFSQKLCWCA